MPFSTGDVIRVRVLHADGQCYRAWQAVVERVTPDYLTTLSLLGSIVEDVRGDRVSVGRLRGYYWFARAYNLIEEYDEHGTLFELYANVASPPVMTADGFDHTDYELDVSCQPGQPARILDEDEFEAAARLYRYTPEFQLQCHAAVEAALQLVESWQPAGMPAAWPVQP